MKTFISISAFAFITAGVYGFVDMARDVKNGTMIDYRKHTANRITASELKDDAITQKLKAANKEQEKVKNDRQTIYSAYASVKGKNKNKKEEENIDFMKEYSRGGFVEPVIEETPDLSRADSASAPH